MKISFLILLITGCNPATKYTEQKEYTEHHKVDPDKGWVDSFKASYEVKWEN